MTADITEFKPLGPPAVVVEEWFTTRHEADQCGRWRCDTPLLRLIPGYPRVTSSDNGYVLRSEFVWKYPKA